MANRSRPTQLKRQRERAKAERRTQKQARRLETKSNRPDRLPGEEDPDIAGIRPGPQPSPYDELPGDFTPDDFTPDDASDDVSNE